MLNSKDITTIRTVIREIVREELLADQLREKLDLELDEEARRKIAVGLEQLDRGDIVSAEQLETEFGFERLRTEPAG